MARKPTILRPAGAEGRLIAPPDRGRLVAPSGAPLTISGISARPDAVALSPEHAEQARLQVVLIQHHQQIMASLERELVTLLKTEYGADITPAGAWNLNLADGRLERRQSAVVAAVTGEPDAPEEPTAMG